MNLNLGFEHQLPAPRSDPSLPPLPPTLAQGRLDVQGVVRLDGGAVDSVLPMPSPMAGRATVEVIPTASAYLRYVSIEAMTTRASTVIRSIPTREILTHASMTIPLSRIRSSTSIRLVPPGARSTAMTYLPFLSSALVCAARGSVLASSFCSSS